MQQLITTLRLLALRLPVPLGQQSVSMYGADYENAVFQMHRDCFCKKPGCARCLVPQEERPPNFLYKPLGLEIRWVRAIGQQLSFNWTPSREEVTELGRRCFESVPAPVLPTAPRARRAWQRRVGGPGVLMDPDVVPEALRTLMEQAARTRQLVSDRELVRTLTLRIADPRHRTLLYGWIRLATRECHQADRPLLPAVIVIYPSSAVPHPVEPFLDEAKKLGHWDGRKSTQLAFWLNELERVYACAVPQRAARRTG